MQIAWADALDYQNGTRMKRGDAPGILEALELADGRDFACFFRVFKQFSCDFHPIFTPKNDVGRSFLTTAANRPTVSALSHVPKAIERYPERGRAFGGGGRDSSSAQDKTKTQEEPQQRRSGILKTRTSKVVGSDHAQEDQLQEDEEVERKGGKLDRKSWRTRYERGFRLAFSRIDTVSPLLRVWTGGSIAGSLDGAGFHLYTSADYKEAHPMPDWAFMGNA